MNPKQFILLLFLIVISAGCRLIDDDLSVCGEEYNLNYEMRLVTEIKLTIEEKLSAETDKPLAEALQTKERIRKVILRPATSTT